MTDLLTLVSQTETTDEYGDTVISESKRDVFCVLSSIGMKEFYQAAAVGLQPEIKLKIADYLDYAGERYVEFNSVRYKVLRTYRKGNELELTVYREVNQS